jgi:hypothetical protein
MNLFNRMLFHLFRDCTTLVSNATAEVSPSAPASLSAAGLDNDASAVGEQA